MDGISDVGQNRGHFPTNAWPEPWGAGGIPALPAVTIGVMVGVLASIALPDFALAPGVVAGLAAGAAASMKLPFFGALLAALLVGLTATGTAPIAIIAGVTGWLVALRLDLREGG